NVKKMHSREQNKKGFFEVLDWLEKNRPQDIKQFWRCVFEDHILQMYPTLHVLRNSLLDSPIKPPDVKTPTEEESKGKAEKEKEKGYTRKRSIDDRSGDCDDPDLLDIFSVSTPSPKKPDKNPLF
ncbi:hypothetical protein M9458_006830, partial [Cirrhinus mrigala]